ERGEGTGALCVVAPLSQEGTGRGARPAIGILFAGSSGGRPPLHSRGGGARGGSGGAFPEPVGDRTGPGKNGRPVSAVGDLSSFPAWVVTGAGVFRRHPDCLRADDFRRRLGCRSCGPVCPETGIPHDGGGSETCVRDRGAFSWKPDHRGRSPFVGDEG